MRVFLYTSVQMTSEARGITSPGDRFTRLVSYPMWILGVELGSPGGSNASRNRSTISPARNAHPLLPSALLNTLCKKPEAQSMQNF